MDLWRKERIQSVLYKAVKQEDVEMAAKCLKMGAVDMNTRYEPVRSFITRNSNVAVRIRMSKYVYCPRRLKHTAGLDTIFVQIYMDALRGVPGVSKNQIFFFTNKTVEFLR